MVFTTVNVEIHKDGLGHMQEFVDYADGNKFYNHGVQALAALKAHKTIDINYPELGEKIIPYHAVLSWSVTKEDGEYTKPEDDFCKPESEPTPAPIPTSITLLDGTYEFTDDKTAGLYRVSLAKCYEPANVTVTVDGTTVTLPKFESAESITAMLYGEFGEDDIPVFTTYPAAVVFSNTPQGMVLNVAAPTAGSHTVKVTVPNGSEAECSK